VACPAAGEHAVVPLWVRKQRRCRVPQRALRDAGSLDEYLKCVGVRARKRQKLLKQYVSDSSKFSKWVRIAAHHVDRNPSPSNKPVACRLVFSSPRLTTKTAVPFPLGAVPPSPPHLSSPTDLKAAVASARAAASSAKPVRALERFLTSLLDKEREALEADIATLRSSVAHANERIAQQRAELGRAVDVLQWQHPRAASAAQRAWGQTQGP
jgi:hypothetical protein